MSRRKNAELLIIPVVSGYGPRVSVGDTAQAALTVPGVVVVVVVVAVGLVDEPPQAATAAPTPAPSAASTSRRRRVLRTWLLIWKS
jgi:hypothetical protein